jgi:hypothetical protein
MRPGAILRAAGHAVDGATRCPYLNSYKKFHLSVNQTFTSNSTFHMSNVTA